MEILYREKAKNDPSCELCIGIATWDSGTKETKSIKYAWKTSKGTIARGGEVPIEALQQMLDFAIRKGFLK